MTVCARINSKLGFEKAIPAKLSFAGDLLWALLYAGLGVVALSLTVPPGYAAPFFPAAGLAIAAVGFRGARGLLSVVLGSFIVQMVAWWQLSGAFGVTLSSLLIPLFAGLQALAAIWLAPRFKTGLLQIEDAGPVLRLLFLVVPLACIVNAGLSVPLLLAMGAVLPEHFWFNFWSWWLGDALGAMVLLPIAILFLAPRASTSGLARRWSVTVLLIASSLVCVTLLQMGLWERERIQAEFERRAASLHRQIDRALQVNLTTLRALHAHAESGGNVWDPEAFAQFVTPWLRDHPGIQNLTFNPRVTANDRARFESELRERGQFVGILDRQADPLGLVPAQERASYFPIAVVEPLANNQVVLGLDPSSIPTVAPTIEQARLAREPFATPSFRLTQEQGNQRGVVVYWPVWQNLPSGESVEVGLVSMALRIEDVMLASLGGNLPQDFWLCLTDVSDPDRTERLMGADGCEATMTSSDGIGWSSELTYAHRQWQVRLLPTDAYLEAQRGWAAWVLMVVLVFAVALLSAFLLLVSGQARRIEGLVKERTRQLHEALAQVEQQKSELALLVNQDPLTGLPNRTHWMQLAEHAMAQLPRSQRPLAVAFLDLDGFKAVNDQKGHYAGDLLLQAVAQRVQSVLRTGDALARHGGDEFVLLLPGLSSEQDAAIVAQRVVEALALPFDLDEGIGQVEISVSLGLAAWPAHGKTMTELLRAADSAMYRAKAAGRNRWSYPE